jgi:hypothetical protein
MLNNVVGGGGGAAAAAPVTVNAEPTLQLRTTGKEDLKCGICCSS